MRRVEPRRTKHRDEARRNPDSEENSAVYRIDSALDRSVRQGHLIHSAAASGAFRPASGHIDPIRSRQGDRELLYVSDPAGTHQESN
jgi:hypothetical protein